MSFPDLLKLLREANYEEYFRMTYCQRPIVTFDGIVVRFRRNDFQHCAYESSGRNGTKDTFSLVRAERLSWIHEALVNPQYEKFEGWDSKRKVYDAKRRVTIMVDDFVVVIQLIGESRAKFITCYVADSPRTKRKILDSPKWGENPF